MKYTLSDMIISQDKKIRVPELLHFVWIGDNSKAPIQYMELWRKSNLQKKTILWCENDFHLCQVFHETISDYVNNSPNNDKSKLEIQLKNSAFDYVYPKLSRGLRFDDVIDGFFKKHNIPFQITPPHECNTLMTAENLLIKDIGHLFSGEYGVLKRFYYYEIILRGNLASASDIVRLIVIHLFGGTYIDMDTLPCTDSVFKSLNLWKSQQGYVEEDFIKLFKTKKILNKLGLLNVSDDEYINNYASSENSLFYNKILSKINQDIADFSQSDILPLGTLYVHKNLLSIGAVSELDGIYFNNVISSHPLSKTVHIILRVMKKRYVFLERSDFIFNACKGSEDGSYLSRILSWRTELITKNYCVTSVLTGPGLIVEVLLGLAYELMDAEYLTAPAAIARDMHNEAIGIAFFRHNLHTPEGICSSWMK